jgi:ubiquitin-like-conjugating enzyme ATG3
MICFQVIEAETDDGGWVDTHHFVDKTAEKVSEMSLGEEKKASETVPAANQDDDSDQEAVDMEDFIESGLADEEDQSAVAVAPKSEDKKDEAAGGEIVATRTYDLNITYDKFYQTPRLWLFGYDEKKKALTVDEMYEDFSADHANKTITMEAHPHLPGPPQASVHPCRHAQVRIVATKNVNTIQYLAEKHFLYAIGDEKVGGPDYGGRRGAGSSHVSHRLP